MKNLTKKKIKKLSHGLKKIIIKTVSNSEIPSRIIDLSNTSRKNFHIVFILNNTGFRSIIFTYMY